jgi:hypothetical protein
MECLKELILSLATDRGSMAEPQGPTDKEIHMTDTTMTDAEWEGSPETAEPSTEQTTEFAIAPEPVEDEAPVQPTVEDDATVQPTVEDEPVEPKNRRGRGQLESDVKRLCDAYVSGDLKLPEGREHLTPHVIARAIQQTESLVSAPSTGAVAAVLDRWEVIGFAVVSDKPKAFVDYTVAGRSEGLTALKAKSATGKREQRKAMKAAEASAEGESPAAPEPTASSTDLGDQSPSADGFEPAWAQPDAPADGLEAAEPDSTSDAPTAPF